MAAYLAQYGLNEVRPRRPEQFQIKNNTRFAATQVSMKSGLEGRNNGIHIDGGCGLGSDVSMKSGLEGRNNAVPSTTPPQCRSVSMKSGLEGRNNVPGGREERDQRRVSMKSGLEGRNNSSGR